MFEALELMFTGMSTVFFVLIMVVVLGNGIIRITNKFSQVPLTITVNEAIPKTTIEPTKIAAIFSAVEISTNGKGKVISIERIADQS